MVPKMDVGGGEGRKPGGLKSFYRQGKPEPSKGYCEDVIMDEALKFIRASVERKRPFLAIVWNMAVPARPAIWLWRSRRLCPSCRPC
jgi:hypothetical protein